MKRLLTTVTMFATFLLARQAAADVVGFPDQPYQVWTAGAAGGVEVEFVVNSTIKGVGVVVNGLKSSRTSFKMTVALYASSHTSPSVMTLVWSSAPVDLACVDSTCRLEKSITPATVVGGRYFLYFVFSETPALYVASTRTPYGDPDHRQVAWAWDSLGWGKDWPRQLAFPRLLSAYPPCVYLLTSPATSSVK